MKNELESLANTIVNYSLDLQKNERVLISYQTINPLPLVKAIINEVNKVGGVVFTDMIEPSLNSLLLENTTSNRIDSIYERKKYEVDNFDAFVTIAYSTNDFESKNVSSDILKAIGDKTKDVNKKRINNRKWVLLNYPSILDAFKAKMNTKEFYDYAFRAMNVDYKKMNKDLQALKEVMEKTDKVRIVSPNTDISFSIKGINKVICSGEKNIPDGEVYTAPVRDSVNGTITYNVSSSYQGGVFENISLTFKDGKIVEASASDNNKRLQEIFDTDEGSRYVGEFSLGVNPTINNPMGDILYDEKINGSIHFTPGSSYDDASNGNKSSIHWDLVLIQTEKYGGGQLYFDDVLIRDNGKFVIPELEHLN